MDRRCSPRGASHQRPVSVNALIKRITSSRALQVAIVLALIACINLPLITRAGFSSTEGHRVVPGWEMLDTGDYLVPHMFGRVYLRKPPGIAWAMAASGALLGQTELSARLVSVLATMVMGLLVLVFATRWFGSPWGLVGAVALALFPMYWPPGRSAEIEALNNMATLAAALAAMDLGVATTRADRIKAWWVALLLGAGALLMVIVKGPAGAPGVAGALISAAICTRTWRAVLRIEIIAPLAIAGIAIGALALVISQAIPPDSRLPMTQSVGDFLWDGDSPLERIGAVLLLLPRAALAGLPLTALLLIPWLWKDKLLCSSDNDRRALLVAQACSLAWIISIAILMVCGVSNHRYTMTSMVFLPPLAPPTIRAARWYATRGSSWISRLLLLNHPLIWMLALLISAAIFIPIYENGRARRSGRAAGYALALDLPDGARVLADHLVEARPEVLLYARRAAHDLGNTIHPLWIDHRQAAAEVKPGDFLVLRTDSNSTEAVLLADLPHEVIADGHVHEYTFELWRAR